MIKINRADEKDKDDVSVLFDQYRSFYKMPRDIISAKKFINERLVNKDSFIFLAKDSEIACGFIQVYPAFSSVAMRPIWILNDLFVNNKHRKKGCAKALMDYVKDEATKNNIFSIKLATAINNSKAKRLYESLNYKKIDTFDNYSLKI